MLCFSLITHAFADEINEPPIEGGEGYEQINEEPKEEEKVVEDPPVEDPPVEEPPTEDPPADPPAVVYPFIVTYHFYYRGANAVWREVTYSQVVSDESFNASKAVSYFSKQITNNNFQEVSDSNSTYTWLGTWGNGALSDADRVYINATLFHEATDISYYADYSVKSEAHLTFVCSDSVANGSHTAANVDVTQGYSHTFSTPPDIPSQYTFLYWENGASRYAAGETFSIAIGELTEDTTITYTAVYSYQPTVKLHYHDKDSVTTVTASEDIDIYANAPINVKWFYEGEDTPIAAGSKVTVPEAIITTVPQDVVKEEHVYSKYFDIKWVNYNDALLYTSKDVPYDEKPVYKGATPTRPEDSSYLYHFYKWAPDVVAATKEATYKAVYQPTAKPTPCSFSYTVTYLPGIYGTFEKQISVVSYNSKTPAPPAVTGIEGYEFVGWDPKVSDRVTSSITYTAQWKEIEKPELEPEPTPEIVEIIEPIKVDPPTRAIEPPVEEEVKTWSLINLILLFGTVFTLVNIGSNKKYNIFNFVFVICSILMFIWFEDVHSHMILVNKYTIIMVLLYVAQLLSRVLAKEEDKEEEIPSEEQSENTP